MTNKEKFIEVFNQEPDEGICPGYCKMDGEYCPYYKIYCTDGTWWKQEYKGTDGKD